MPTRGVCRSAVCVSYRMAAISLRLQTSPKSSLWPTLTWNIQKSKFWKMLFSLAKLIYHKAITVILGYLGWLLWRLRAFFLTLHNWQCSYPLVSLKVKVWAGAVGACWGFFPSLWTQRKLSSLSYVFNNKCEIRRQKMIGMELQTKKKHQSEATKRVCKSAFLRLCYDKLQKLSMGLLCSHSCLLPLAAFLLLIFLIPKHRLENHSCLRERKEQMAKWHNGS